MDARDDDPAHPSPHRSPISSFHPPTTMDARDDDPAHPSPHRSPIALFHPPTTMDACDDDFSRLPDELLLNILRFVPAKEGVRTTTLSNRWRPLWTSCGAVNLEARILEDDEQRFMEEQVFFDRRDKFVADARKVLDAFTNAPVPITMLTIRVEGHTANIVRDFLNREANWRGRPQVLAGFLAHRAARVVQELRIAAVDNIAGEPMLFEKVNQEVDWATYGTRMFSLNLHSLPSGTLRVLDLINCELVPGLTPPCFPHLWKLRLRHCELLIQGLQTFINSAPFLAFIQLEYVLLEDDRVQPDLEGDVLSLPPERSLNCPAATTIVIFKCCLKEEGTLQIFAPMLQRFEYNGILRRIVLSPTPRDLLRVDITVIEYRRKQHRDMTAIRQSFWGFLQGFIHVKQINLRIPLLKGIDVTSQGILLPVLHKIECLEISLIFSPTQKKATILIADLLSCCPKLRNLLINLRTSKENSLRGPEYSNLFLKSKFDADSRRSEDLLTWPVVSAEEVFEESAHRSKRLKMQPAVAAEERHYFDELSELPKLSDRQFDCLQNTLKRVALRFHQGEKSSFGEKLVKFFAENAKVLEEMCVDSGNARLGDHLNHKIKNWIATFPEDKRFKILPLKRQNEA